MRNNLQIKAAEYRPQANFLPQAPKRGTIYYTAQKPSKRLQSEGEEKQSSVVILWPTPSLSIRPPIKQIFLQDSTMHGIP